MRIKNYVRKLYLRLFKAGYYRRRKEDLDFYLDFIPAGSLCFDVGANRGDKSKALLASGMNVVSFEPQPECLSHLVSHCEDFAHRLRTRRVALGDRPGSAKLYRTDQVGHASLHEDWSPEGRTDSIEVELSTLDLEIEKYGVPYYCKIDVEGHELEVISGLSQPLSLISFEYHLTPENIEKTLLCIDNLTEKSNVFVNISGAECNRLHYRKWKTPQEFLELFPDNFRTRRDFRYGDIYIKKAD